MDGAGRGLAGSPLTLLREYVLVLRRLLAGESVSSGRYVRVREARPVHPTAVVSPDAGCGGQVA